MSLRRFGFTSLAIISISIFTAQFAAAQLKLPRASQKASVTQTIGVTDLTVIYSRPGIKGRKIWGDAPDEAKGEKTLDDAKTREKDAPLVLYGHIWRTGADDATQFVVTDDVLVNGQPLPAGTYSLHTIPGKDEWTVVFNGVANQWGSFSYDATKDTLRVKAKPLAVPESQEWLGFTIDPSADNAAIVNIRWEKLRVPFTVEVKDVAATTIARAQTVVSAVKSDDWATPFNAGNYAKQNKATAQSTKWFEQSLKAIDEQIKVKETFQNLSRKSSSLLALGRMPEAIAVAEKAVTAGKAEKADTSALEKRIADMKAGKM